MATSQRANIFVSSVYKELIECRRAALDAVWRCDYYPLGMEREDYAKPVTTGKTSMEMVDQAEAYVGIFSHRYGVVTAEEFRHAQERGIPILPFFAAAPLNEGDHEVDPERVRLLDELKRELRQQYTVATFGTVEELSVKVYRSLVALRDVGMLPRNGRAPANLPTPPKPYYAHDYILGGGGFVGRKAELARLDAWARSGEPVLAVEAIGGAGKSALAWDWVQSHLDSVLPGRAGVIWWSFYESDAATSTFLARALAYLTQRPAADCAGLMRHEQVEQVLALLDERQVVVVLDGLERLLIGYHRPDVPELADITGEEQPRACVDPSDGALLRALTRSKGSKILITTRLVPTDLRDPTGQLVQGVRLLPLSGLSAADAIALMERAGVRGTRGLMRTFLAQFGDHALLVQVLAGRIRAYHPAPGDFDAWYQAVGRHLELDLKDLTARHESVLDAALADLDPAIFRFLCQMATYVYPMDYAALVALNAFTEPLRGEAASPSRPVDDADARARYDAEAARERLHRALTELEERGLLQWDREDNRYDLHPVVRAYAYARLRDKPATLKSLLSYFRALPAEDLAQVQDVADLRRTLEIYHALVESSQLDEAFRLYRSRLGASLLHDLGAYTTIVALATPLFPHGFAEPPALASARDQAYLANDLEIVFHILGDFAQARALRSLCVRLNLHARDAQRVSQDLASLGDALVDEGRLAEAEKALLVARDLAAAAGMQRQLDMAQRDLLGLYARTGDWASGGRAYATLLSSGGVPIRSGPLALIYAARLRFAQGEDPADLLDQALTDARSQRFLRAEREARRLSGEVALVRGDLGDAEEAWLAAYAIAQRESQRLGSYLADLARVRARQGDAAQARELITEALAGSGGLGIELAAAEVYHTLDETAAAGRHAVPAYREAWADGPPYAFALELERARAVVAALGLPEPSLPIFDPAKVPPVPYEAEIRSFIAELALRPKPHDPSAMNQTNVPSLSAEPDRPPREDDQRHPGTIDQTRIAAFIAPPEPQGAERDRAVFDESRVGAFIAKWDSEREIPPAEESGEKPSEVSAVDSSAEGDLSAPIAPIAPAGRRNLWEALWKRDRK